MLANENPFMRYDVRLLKSHFAKGKLTKKDYEQYLRTIEDVSENSEIIPREAIFDLPQQEVESTELDDDHFEE